jgi:hypothetical protein
MDTSRMTGFQIQQHQNKLRYKEQQMSKEQFENDLRQSTERTTNSGSALFGANKNIFEQDLTKDTSKTLNLNRRKTSMKQKMIDMIDELNEPEFKRFESVMIEFYLTK